MRFEADGVDVARCGQASRCRTTPAIKLRDTDILFQQGVLRTEKGLFDGVFRIDGNFARNQSELLDSQKQDQQKTRDDLSSAITDVTRLSDSLTAAGALLQDKNQAFNNSSSWNLSTIKDPTSSTR